jgi:hypothetical protein
LICLWIALRFCPLQARARLGSWQVPPGHPQGQSISGEGAFGPRAKLSARRREVRGPVGDAEAPEISGKSENLGVSKGHWQNLVSQARTVTSSGRSLRPSPCRRTLRKLPRRAFPDGCHHEDDETQNEAVAVTNARRVHLSWPASTALQIECGSHRMPPCCSC